MPVRLLIMVLTKWFCLDGFASKERPHALYSLKVHMEQVFSDAFRKEPLEDRPEAIYR